jgi:hypothetical protein
MDKKFWKKISGRENLLKISKFRFIFGFVFIIYGIVMLNLTLGNVLTSISISLAFIGLGFMFILDGQSILREYFSKEK